MLDLDQTELVAVIRRLEQEFGWDNAFRGLAPTDRWESRTSSLHVLGEQGNSVVLKVGRSWNADKAEEAYSDLTALEALFEAHPELRVNVPRILGWSKSPPAVCQVRVYGEDLGKVIGHRERYLRPDLPEVMSRLGGALGLFLASNLRSPADLTPEREADLRLGLLKMARRLRIDPGLVSPDHVLISRQYGDFSPHNQILSDDGSLWIVDQPSSYVVAPVHRDVAYYLDRLSTHIGRYDSGSRHEVSEITIALQQAFLAGYRETGPTDLSSSRDQNLIRVYRAYKSLHAARKRLRQRRLSEVPRYLRLMVHWRNQVVKSGEAAPAAI